MQGLKMQPEAQATPWSSHQQNTRKPSNKDGRGLCMGNTLPQITSPCRKTKEPDERGQAALGKLPSFINAPGADLDSDFSHSRLFKIGKGGIPARHRDNEGISPAALPQAHSASLDQEP
jgi:hypothetical protein